MAATLASVASHLDECAQILTTTQVNSDPNQTFVALYGWNFPALSLRQLGELARKLAEKIRTAERSTADEDFQKDIDSIENSLSQFKSMSLPHFFNGNITTALPTFLHLMSYIEAIISVHVDWACIPTDKLPPQLLQRLQRAQVELSRLEPELVKLDNSVSTIKQAEELANRLPSTLQDLKDAENQLKHKSNQAVVLLALIEQKANDATQSAASADEQRTHISELLQRSSDLFGSLNSLSLSKSFHDKGNRLANSMQIWVWLLAGSLVVAMTIGTYNFYHIDQLLRNSVTEPWKILSYVLFSILSVGGPVWFGWMSTKQISQRFKLSEDYAFKAAIASAYEGYKRETVAIDPELSKKLIESAMLRLDENPLRFVETKNFGSPLHELVESRGLRQLVTKLSNVIPITNVKD